MRIAIMVIVAVTMAFLGFTAGVAVTSKRWADDIAECNSEFEEAVQLGFQWKVRAMDCERKTTREESL